MSTRNAECDGCGVTAADMPYEDMGLDLEGASDMLFIDDSDGTFCQGCAS